MGRDKLDNCNEIKEKFNIIEFLHLLIWFVKHRKEFEEFMSQVQFTLSLSVTAASQPLAITPPSGAATFVVGTASSSTLGAVTGGVPPYTPTVDAASPSQLAPGLSLSMDANNNLILSGTPTAAGSGTVVIDVNDSAGATAQVKHTPVGAVVANK